MKNNNKNKDKKIDDLVIAARHNLIGDVPEGSKKAFDTAIAMSEEEAKKTNDELHSRIYFLLGRALVHTEIGKFAMQRLLEGNHGAIMPGAEDTVKEDVAELAEKMEESIGYGAALLDKRLLRESKELIAGIFDNKKKCCAEKCSVECKKPARDEKGRFIKKTCNKKASCKPAKNKKHDNVSWF